MTGSPTFPKQILFTLLLLAIVFATRVSLAQDGRAVIYALAITP